MPGIAYVVIIATLAATPAARRLVYTLALLVALVLVWLGYLVTCRLWPFAKCNRCNGTGTRPAPGRKAFRNCPRCKGTGRRLRIGRRLLDRKANR
ncbi:hypothetical protein [Kribbella sp. NPDC051770]|uniref:hypothetical protein n=1 Tax=Kribbella sp. NPDC051770 TaxID=3155413 RepID=UPI003426DDB2